MSRMTVAVPADSTASPRPIGLRGQQRDAVRRQSGGPGVHEPHAMGQGRSSALPLSESSVAARRAGRPAVQTLPSVERSLGCALRGLRDHQLFLQLGFARLGDYVAERLGMSLRTAQELIRVAEALSRLPRTATAYEAGEISSGHVRVVCRVATPESEEIWLVRARRMDVRALARCAAGHIEQESPASADVTGPLSDNEPALAPLRISAPVWLIRWWRDTVTLAQRLVGSAIPSGAALELIVAESVDSGRGLADPDQPGSFSAAAGGRCIGTREAPDVTSLGQPSPASPPSSGALQVESGAAPRSAGLLHGEYAAAGRPADAATSAGPVPDARVLDARLKALATARQRAEASIADRLACARVARSFLLEGCGSMEHYALRRFGLSPRRMYYLLSLHRTLERLPELRRAYLGGSLTLRQTLLLGRVASRRTAPAWIRRAASITLRRLEDEVNYWELIRDERPEVWEKLAGGPLPEGIALVPGHAPRLHRSACGKKDLDHGDSPRPIQSGNRQWPACGGDATSQDPSLPQDRACDLHGTACGGDTVAEECSRPEVWTCNLHGPARGGNADERCKSMRSDETSGLRGSPREVPIDARTFLAALAASEADVPLPARMGVLRMRVEPGVLTMWRDVVSRLRADCDGPLEEWEALALLIRRFQQVWDNKETRRQRREHPTMERDGWRCTAPGCTAIGTGKLHEHHIIFRSHGGAETDPANVTSLCTTHHEHLLHKGTFRCRGEAPDGLTWELGVKREADPFLVYRGDVLAGGAVTSGAPASRSLNSHAL